MQHVIELDQQTEQILSHYISSSGKTEHDILASAVKDFLRNRTKPHALERVFQPFEINLDGFSFDREEANER